MAQQWQEFCDGSANRCDYESGEDGVNLRDYFFRLGDSSTYETVLEHNCTYQTND